MYSKMPESDKEYVSVGVRAEGAIPQWSITARREMEVIVGLGWLVAGTR